MAFCLKLLTNELRHSLSIDINRHWCDSDSLYDGNIDANAIKIKDFSIIFSYKNNVLSTLPFSKIIGIHCIVNCIRTVRL